MRVYVSTTSRRIEAAKAAMWELKARGREITHDWTDGFDEEERLSEAELSERAAADVEGAATADAVIVLMLREMGESMIGAAVEIGAALAAKVPVFIVEEELRFIHFFESHPGISLLESLGDALDILDMEDERC